MTVTFTTEDMWSLLYASDTVRYDDFTTAQLARLDRIHCELKDAIRCDDRRAACYVLHANVHLPHVFVDHEQKTFEFHNNTIAHMISSRSVDNSDGLLDQLTADGYRQVLN